MWFSLWAGYVVCVYTHFYPLNDMAKHRQEKRQDLNFSNKLEIYLGRVERFFKLFQGENGQQ